MQTFLPYADFTKSAECLDKKRCWKQVVETKQILNCLTGKSEGWKNHPAVKMWVGYVPALIVYYNIFWTVSTEKHKIRVDKLQKIDNIIDVPCIYPEWFGDNRLHSSHRSNLLRKDKEFYGQYGWLETDDMPYWWPTKNGD